MFAHLRISRRRPAIALVIAGLAAGIGLITYQTGRAIADDVAVPAVCAAVSADGEGTSLAAFRAERAAAAPTRVCHQVVVKDGKLDKDLTTDNTFTIEIVNTEIKFTLGGKVFTGNDKAIVATFKGVDLTKCTVTIDPGDVAFAVNPDAKDQLFVYTSFKNVTITANCPKP